MMIQMNMMTKTKGNDKMIYSFNLISPFNGNTSSFNSLFNARNAIFLAGPCPRKDFADDWRFEAFDILDRFGFTGNVITPSNQNYSKMLTDFGMTKENALKTQTTWERAAMSVASAIVFWIPRDEQHPARTTNFELGEWYKKNNIFVGWPDGAMHNEYIACKLAEQGKQFYQSLEEMLSNVIQTLTDNEPTMYFTSDTHFCQQRTLELSRRPFFDVTTMDLEMISNWNKRITMNDDVVHAGDFMDPEKVQLMLKPLLSILNFKTLHWVLGNYDQKIKSEIEHIISDSGRDVILYDNSFKFTTDKHSYVVVHEPNDFAIDAKPNDIILFGHIHGRSFAKRNGFDLGIDYHQYSPISLEQVEWFANAMKYWDENVYSDIANIQK